MKSSKSCILFWNFEDLHAIDPILILTSPMEVLHFEFNPKDPNIIVAGTVNGQIAMWDLHSVSFNGGIKKQMKPDRSDIREIQPLILSALQDPSNVAPITDQVRKNVPSHRQPVLFLKWFPSGLELEMKKSFSTIVNNPSGDINQFATISSDGQVLLWDRRFQDPQKKQAVDVRELLRRSPRSPGRQDTDSRCLDLKEEGSLVELNWPSRSNRKLLPSLPLPIRESS